MPGEQAAGRDTDAEHAPATKGRGPDRLSLIVFSGTFAKVHYALVLASAAAAIGTPATLFFTMAAARYLAAPQDDGTPGWRALSAAGNGEGEGIRPAAETAGDADDVFRERGVATFEELLSACVELGVRFMVCEMGLRAMNLHRSDLRKDIPIEEAGVVTMLGDASATGAVLFI